MKIDFVKYGGYIIAIILLLLLLKNCNSEPQIIEKKFTIKVPQTVKVFEKSKPIHTNLTKIVKSEFEQQEINRILKEWDSDKKEFEYLTDSLKNIKYEKVTEPKEYFSKFEDKFSILEISGIVKGEIVNIKPKITIKERKIDTVVKIKKRKLNVDIGTEINNDFTVKGNLQINNFTVGYDTNKNYWIGYKLKIL